MPIGFHVARPVSNALAMASIVSLLVTPAVPALAEEGGGTGQTTLTTSQSNANIAVRKREAVTAVTSPAGAVKSISVTTTLETGGLADVADASSLHRLTPVEEGVWASTQGELVWHSPDGKDITYTAASNKALPIQVRVSYNLDGNDVSPSELAGASGHLVIRYDYVDAELANNGKTTNSPFMAATSVELSPSVFSNVSVSNGRLVRDGMRLFALGGGTTDATQATDGSSANYFQIEADVSNFWIPQATTVAASDLIDALHDDGKSLHTASDKVMKEVEDYLKKLDELRTTVDEIKVDTEAVAQHIDQTSQLANNLQAASQELEANTTTVDTINTQANNLTTNASAANAAVQNFASSIYARTDLTQEQKDAILEEYSAVQGAVSQVEADAFTLRDNVGSLSFASTSQAAAALRAVNFQEANDKSHALVDRLNELLEHGFSDGEIKEKGSLIGDGITLRDDLNKLSQTVAGTEATAGGLASSNLELMSRVALAAQQTPTEIAPAKAGGTVLASVASEVTSALTQIEQTQTAPDPAPNAYTNYGGITAGTDGSVHFIFQTEGIGV